MADLLVKLYELPPLLPALDVVSAVGIQIRPARGGEEHAIRPSIERHFNPGWALGIEYAVNQSPYSLFIAVEKSRPDSEPGPFRGKLVGM